MYDTLNELVSGEMCPSPQPSFSAGKLQRERHSFRVGATGSGAPLIKDGASGTSAG